MLTSRARLGLHYVLALGFAHTLCACSAGAGDATDSAQAAEGDDIGAVTQAVTGLHRLGNIRDSSSTMGSKMVSVSAPPVGLPTQVDLTAQTAPPGDQQSEGSCVGWAVGYAAKTLEENVEETWSPTPTNHRFSPAWVYNQINGGVDNGASFSTALNLLVSKGADNLDAFPYVNGAFTTQPDAASFSRAARFKAKSWNTVATNTSQIKSVLAQGSPVIIGIEVLPDFDNLNASTNTVYNDSTGTSRGRHAVTLIGYDDTRNAFKLINSWGTGWGSGGYGWLDYAFITDSKLAMDAYVLVDGANQHLFAAQNWLADFSDANGWNQAKYPVLYADIDGDQRTDICGRGVAGMLCAKSNGTSFTGLSNWQSSFSDGNGWTAPEYYSTLRLVDVNGDKKADVCGRGAAGVWCGISNGSSFGTATQWDANLSDLSGFNQPQYNSTLSFADINGDAKADLCVRGIAGILCSLSTGSSFGPLGLWEANFSDANGWNQPQYYSTIRFIDVNGDKKADLCARGTSGILCSISNGSSFSTPTLWQGSYSDGNSWNQPQYYGTIGFPDIDGDGKADVCGRSSIGTYCARSNGSSFGTASVWESDFSDANGWNASKYYQTVQYPDVNQDGKADLCGRGTAGLYCAISNGASFKNRSLWDNTLSDGAGWDQPIRYNSIKLVSAEKDVYKRLCFRGATGVTCR